MSLLIKALANAEKDKLAERDKKSTDAGLSLELTPKEDLKLAEGTHRTTQQKTEIQLSLEEEAGLGSIPAATKKLDPIPERKPLEKTPNQLNSHVTDAKSLQFSQAETKPLPKSTERITELQAAAPMVDNNQKTAAKVFVANQALKPSSSITSLLFLGIGGALLILLSLQGYKYFTKPAPTNITVAEIPAQQPSNIIEKKQETVEEDLNTESTQQLEQEVLPTVALTEDAEKITEKLPSNEQPSTNKNKIRNTVTSSLTTKDAIQSEDIPSNDARNTGKPASLKLTSKSPIAGVDPTLLAAYQAFTRGEDASAQQQYRQVLQHDVRNVDALLGMAAIAQRQGREADASGWFQKVIEVDPQNSIAQTALVNPQVSNDKSNAESRIKNLLTSQPEAAHLHAALGNIYAEQNQWASAQAAYFDASRFAPNNADYAFNLAVSLEQMGKQRLAFSQYQRALELLNQLGGSSPDRATLEARIQVLQ